MFYNVFDIIIFLYFVVVIYDMGCLIFEATWQDRQRSLNRRRFLKNPPRPKVAAKRHQKDREIAGMLRDVWKCLENH